MAIQQRHTNWQQVWNLQCLIYMYYFVHVLYVKLWRTLTPARSEERRELSVRTTHGKNNTHKWETEGFVPVASLCGVVGLPSLFIISLIGRTGKMWSIVYINAKWTYTSGNLACTIRECATVRNVLQVTSTCQFISWCSGASNIKQTPRVWH